MVPTSGSNIQPSRYNQIKRWKHPLQSERGPELGRRVDCLKNRTELQLTNNQETKKKRFLSGSLIAQDHQIWSFPYLEVMEKEKLPNLSAFSSITCAMQSPLDGHPSHHPNPLDLFVLQSSCPLPPQIWCSCSTFPWPQHNIHVHFLVLAPLCCGLDTIDRYIKHVVNIESTCFWKLETLTYKLKVVQK